MSSNISTHLQTLLDTPLPEFRKNSSSEAKRILDCHNLLGECILYDERTNQVIWEDINERQFHSLDLSTRVHTFQQYDKMLCAFALLSENVCNSKGSYLFAWEDGFQLYDTVNNKPLSTLSEGEDVNPKKLPTRLNDGRVDPTGKRFICGGYYGDIECNYMKVFKCEFNDKESKTLKHEAVVEQIQVTNSICWSLDGDTMYLADSPTKTIFKNDFDQDEGIISNRQPLCKYEVGVPDGSCVDSMGYIWNAVWRNGAGTSEVRCIDPSSGKLIHTVTLPDNTSQLTCCCFGGPDLDILFISSASIGLDQEQEPYAGCLYGVKVGVKGRVEKKFG